MSAIQSLTIDNDVDTLRMCVHPMVGGGSMMIRRPSVQAATKGIALPEHKF